MRWQYYVMEDEALLPKLGELGWELVAVLPAGEQVKFYLKRPYPDIKTIVTEQQRQQVFKQFGLE